MRGDKMDDNRENAFELYSNLADWFYLVTAPEDYREEAEFYRKTILENCIKPPHSLLELGSGGGNNASHLKKSFSMTLVDLAKAMLMVSRGLNPECEHIEGDMRNIRLGRQFGSVFIHDAISHINVLDDLMDTVETAYIHCRPGGVALFCPDHIRETFRPTTDHGGHDGERRGLRYLEWTWDPDPEDTCYTVDMAYLLREGDRVSCHKDRFIMGLFSEEQWLSVIREAGFIPQVIEHTWSGFDETLGSRMFLGKRTVD